MMSPNDILHKMTVISNLIGFLVMEVKRIDG